MTDPLGCRMRGAVIYPMPPFGDVGVVEVIVALHPYLLCDPCGGRLDIGLTTLGATVFVCVECAGMMDVRRVA